MTAREWLDYADELDRMLADLREIDPKLGPYCAQALADRVELLVERIRAEFTAQLN